MGLAKTVETLGTHSLDTSNPDVFCNDLGHRLGFNIIFNSYKWEKGWDIEKLYNLGYAESLNVEMEYEEDEILPWFYSIDKFNNLPFERMEFYRSGFVLTFTEYSNHWRFFTDALITQFEEYNDRQQYIDMRNALIPIWQKLGCNELIIYTEYLYSTISELESGSQEYFKGKDLQFLIQELETKEEISFFDYAGLLELSIEIPDPYQHKVFIKDRTKYHGIYRLMFHDDFRELKTPILKKPISSKPLARKSNITDYFKKQF